MIASRASPSRSRRDPPRKPRSGNRLLWQSQRPASLLHQQRSPVMESPPLRRHRLSRTSQTRPSLCRGNQPPRLIANFLLLWAPLLRSIMASRASHFQKGLPPRRPLGRRLHLPPPETARLLRQTTNSALGLPLPLQPHSIRKNQSPLLQGDPHLQRPRLPASVRRRLSQADQISPTPWRRRRFTISFPASSSALAKEIPS